MKHCYIAIYSKNKTDINNFLTLLNKILTSFNIVIKHDQKKRRKKILTILKSPHINKSAQEQFESKIFTKQIKVYSQEDFCLLTLLKKTKNNMFPSIKLKTKFVLNKKSEKNIKLIDPNNFKLKYFSKYINQKLKVNVSKQFQKYKLNASNQTQLNIFETYGKAY